MAKADDKVSTPAPPPGSIPIVWFYEKRRVNGGTRRECLAYMTDGLRSDDITVYPPLPPQWRLELGPQDEIYLETGDGTLLDARAFSFGYRNMLTPGKPTPGQQAAVDAMFASKAELAASSEPAKVLSAPEPKEWFDQVRETHPQRPGERPGRYLDRLHGRMVEDAEAGKVTEVWTRANMHRRYYEK